MKWSALEPEGGKVKRIVFVFAIVSKTLVWGSNALTGEREGIKVARSAGVLGFLGCEMESEKKVLYYRSQRRFGKSQTVLTKRSDDP